MHTAAGEFLTCQKLGLKNFPLSVSTSDHTILNVLDLARADRQPSHSFAAITCPACNGKHRPHNYDKTCKKTKDTAELPAKPDKSSEDVRPVRHTIKMKPRTSADDKVRTIPTETPDVGFRPSGSASSSRRAPDVEIVEKDDEEARPDSREPVPDEPKVEEKKEPGKIKPKSTVTMPIALKRIHDKLSSPTELLRLHLKHYHMSTDQLRRRTSELKLPEDIYKHYDAVVKTCDTRQTPKRAPSRAKVSGVRSETFGELTFVDHGMVDVEGGEKKLVFLILFDGATSLSTEYVVNTMNSKETINLFLEYFEAYQINPKTIVGDQAFTQPDFEDFYAHRNIGPIALGPGTPWPNRAEAAVRTFKKQVTLMVNSLADDPALADVTYRQWVRQARLARNSSVTYGGVTPLEMACGRRPADILNLETATPSQLTSDVPTPEKKIEAVRMLATKAYLEAKQADDVRRDLSAKLNVSSGPFLPGDIPATIPETERRARPPGRTGKSKCCTTQR